MMDSTNGTTFKDKYLQVYENEDIVDHFHENPLPGRNDNITEYFKNLSKNLRQKNNDDTGRTLHLLDVGCGNGRQTKMFANNFGKVTAFDISENMIAKAKKMFPGENISYMVGTSSRLPVDDNSVDVISCIFSAQNFPDMKKFVSECKRVLKVGGVVGMWGDLMDSVALNSQHRPNTVVDTKNLCADLYHECQKHTEAVGDCEWLVFDRYQTMFNNITGIEKTLDNDSKFNVVVTLEEVLLCYMGVPVFRDVEWAWKDFAEKLKQLWNLESVENRDIKLRVTLSPFVIILKKSQENV